MADNSIQVAAKVNTSQLKTGLHEAIAAVSEAVTEIKAQFSEVAAAATKAFDFADSFTKFIDGLKDSVLEVSHLSETTGISVVEITELKDAMNAAGVSTERLPTQLTNLHRAMQQAAGGAHAQVTAFAQLDISTKGWSQQMPKTMDILRQMAMHLANSTTQQRDLAAMSTLLGHGTVGLTAFLKDLGITFNETTGKYEDHGKAVRAAVQDANDLQQAETQLKSAFDKLLLPALGVANDMFRGFGMLAEWAGIELQKFSLQNDHDLEAMKALWYGFGESTIDVAKAVVGAWNAIKSGSATALAGVRDQLEKDLRETAVKFTTATNQMAKDVQKMAELDAKLAQRTEDFMKPAPAKTEPTGDGDGITASLGKQKEQIIDLTRLVEKRSIIEKEIKRGIQDQQKAEDDAAAALAKANEYFANEAKKEQEQQYKGAIDAARDALKEKEQLIEQELLKGKITKQQEIQLVADAKLAELRLEQQYEEEIKKLWSGEPAKVADVQNQINKLVREGALVQTKAVTDGLKDQQKEYQKVLSGMQSAFSSFTSGLLSGHQTIGQSWTKLVTDMATKFVESLEKQLMQFVVHIVTKEALDQAYYAKSGLRAAYNSAKKTFDWASGLFGPVVAGVLASGAFIAVESMGSAAGGQWEVPGIQPTLLHPQEMVLPATLASRIRNVIDNGGGLGRSAGAGITVVVNHSVNAIDAASFQTTIKRHGNIIGNEVARVLKLKGFGGK